jgi:cell division protein FtsW (lipid II flippase)
MTTVLLTLFSLFFIGYSIFIYNGIKAKDGLNRIRGKLSLGITILFIFFVLSLALIYGNLSADGYMFKTTYKASINPSTKSVMVGTDKNCDIQIYNHFSDSEHVVFDFSKKEPMVEIISKRRGAIVNNKLITLKDKNTTKETTIKSGDIIRLGYSDYRLSFDNKSLELHNLFFTPSIINIFNIYSTTTIPNLTKNSSGDTLSIWWLFMITILIVFAIVNAITNLIDTLTSKFTMVGERGYILYPILYFSFFLIFLFLVSIINFTVLQFHQFSVYNKGALYTVLLVYVIMLFIGYLAYLGYKKDKKSKLIAFILIGAVLTLPIINYSYIYTSADGGLFGMWDIFNKTLAMTILDWAFIFVVFGYGFGLFLHGMLNKNNNLFSDKQVNIEPISRALAWSLIAVLVGLLISVFMSEGAGIVVIETLKLFIFFLFTVIFLDAFGNKKHKVMFSFWIVVVFSILMVAIVAFLKDTGSLIQVIVALSIIVLFFFTHLKKIGFINRPIKIIFTILSIAGVMGAIYYINHSTNIRIPMWVAPFEQTLEVENQFYMYYYEQIARGLYLIKQASLFPNDFITQSYTPLANLHTDFIFAMFVNIFGMIGFIAIITAFLITILSFNHSINLFQSSKRDIYRFIYGVNVIFVAYLFSYIIINMLSVLQIFPLTDVPFPILTYGRGVLILFFVLYVFVGLVNYLYLDFVSRGFRGRV